MHWYKLLQIYDAEGQPYVSSRDDLHGWEEWQLSQGKPIERWDNGAWIKCIENETDGVPDDGLWNHLVLPIFSSRVQRALADAKIEGIQYLPIRVLRPDDSEYFGYAIANILNLPEALDREKSDFDVFPEDYFLPDRRGLISGIRKTVLRKKPLHEFHIIRLKEFDVAVFVSQHFVDVYEENKFTGYSFAPVQLT
jgi:hypothetical protein